MAKPSLLSGTIGAWFLSKRGVTVRPHSWLRKTRIKPHYRKNKAYIRTAIQEKRENKSKKIERNGEMKRY